MVTALLVVAACGNDDGAEVRDLGSSERDQARGPGRARDPARGRARHRPQHPGRRPDPVRVGDGHRRGQRRPVDRQPVDHRGSRGLPGLRRRAGRDDAGGDDRVHRCRPRRRHRGGEGGLPGVAAVMGAHRADRRADRRHRRCRRRPRGRLHGPGRSGVHRLAPPRVPAVDGRATSPRPVRSPTNSTPTCRPWPTPSPTSSCRPAC